MTKTISWVLRTFIVPRNHVIYQQNIEENRICFRPKKYQTFLLARNQYSFSFLDFLVSGRCKKKKLCFWRKSTKISARSLCSLAKHYCVILEFLESFWFWYKSSWTRPYNECYEHKDTFVPTNYMWFTNKTLRRIAYFRHKNTTQKIGLLPIIYSFFSSVWSVCKTCYPTQKYKNFGSLDIFYVFCSQVSCFLVNIMNKTISRVFTNSRTEASILGGGGGRPPPPNENIGGGQTYLFCPPPIISLGGGGQFAPPPPWK